MMLRKIGTRLTFRMRLTLSFVVLALGVGALIIALLYLFMRFVPTYLISSVDLGAGEWADGANGANPQPLPSGETGTSDGSVGIVITDVSSILDTLLWAGILILIVMAAIAGWLGWIIAGRTLRPLRRIRDAAKSAGEGQLDHRIDLDGPDDEVRELAETFDHTLDRLERAFTAHQRFAANAAHELRTPLTATKILLDVAASHPDGVDHEDVLAQVGQNNARSIGLVQALLDLTSLETATLRLEALDLATLAENAARRLDNDQDASERGIDLTVTVLPAPVCAEPVLLALLVENLVDNAVRHNDERGFVSISTGTDEARAWITVENSGARISPVELERMVEPLYRGPAADREGYGLGLAIANTIAQSHATSLELTQRRGGGLIARVSLPILSRTLLSNG